MTLTDTLDHLLSVFLRPLRTWIEREFVAPLRAAYDAAMQTKEQYRDGVYLHLRERLEGTDEHPLAEGVPVRPLPQTQDLAHLQSAVEMLAGRKIEVGNSIGIDDGDGLIKCLFQSAHRALITHIEDLLITQSDLDLKLLRTTYFPNLTSVTIPNLEVMNGYSYNYNEWFSPNIATINGSSEVLCMPHLKRFNGDAFIGFPSTNHNFKVWSFPEMTYTRASFAHSYNSIDTYIVDWVEEVYAPKLVIMGDYASNVHFCNFINMRKIVLGPLHNDSYGVWNNQGGSFKNDPKLIHLEFSHTGDPIHDNIPLGMWLPTNALRTDTTASDYIDLREDKDDSGEFIYQNNLQQFLSNFKNYIADRLADRSGIDPTTGSTYTSLTLTLSQAVYDAIQADTEFAIVATITAKNWNITH